MKTQCARNGLASTCTINCHYLFEACQKMTHLVNNLMILTLKVPMKRKLSLSFLKENLK